MNTNIAHLPHAQHADDEAVDQFAAALKQKLAAIRAKGRAGWDSREPGMQQRLSDMLRDHVGKGDPRDVANFAMFLYQRGEAILPPGPAAALEASPLAWGDGHVPQDIVNVALSKGSYGCEVPLYGPSAMQAQARAGYAEGIKAALEAIAQLPTAAMYDQMNGHEDAYRAVERIARPPAESSPDRMAVHLLVASGCVPAAVADKALQISRGLEPGPSAPANDAAGPLQELVDAGDGLDMPAVADAMRAAANALSTPAGAAQVPDGNFRAPLEPSEEMERRGAHAACLDWDLAGEPMDPESDIETTVEAWKAMAAVAQKEAGQQ